MGGCDTLQHGWNPLAGKGRDNSPMRISFTHIPNLDLEQDRG